MEKAKQQNQCPAAPGTPTCNDGRALVCHHLLAPLQDRGSRKLRTTPYHEGPPPPGGAVAIYPKSQRRQGTTLRAPCQRPEEHATCGAWGRNGMESIAPGECVCTVWSGARSPSQRRGQSERASTAFACPPMLSCRLPSCRQPCLFPTGAMYRRTDPNTVSGSAADREQPCN